jgi:ADP-ribosylglycohydrolase
MFARNPALVEATLLSAVNVGGAASAVGAMTGALLGAFNGWSAFPAEWREGLEDVERLEAEATALVDALG